jgi:YbbR domain-containing protein
LRERLSQNAVLKVLSLVFAILLWFYVNSKGKLEVNFVVPLELRNLPSSLVIVSDVIDYVDVRLRGRESLLRNLSSSQISVHLDLAKSHEGENLFYLTEDEADVPAHVEVAKISPKSVTVRFEQLVQKRVSVVPVLVGKPATGYRVTQVEVIPSMVTLEGAKNQVAMIQVLKTQPLDLTSLRGEIVQERQLALQESAVKVLEGESVKVVVHLEH